MEEEELFEHILPKLYFKDNPNMIHIGAFVDNKLVSSIGLYLFNMINNDKRINIACVGAVSTLPEYRNKGIGKTLFRLIEDEVKDKVDFITLSTATKDYKKILKFYVDGSGMSVHSSYLFKKIK